MIRYSHCPVCRSGHIQVVFAAIDHTVSGEQFEIWQCANCSLRFTQDIPDLSSIGRYYKSENYISHSNSGRGLVNMLYLKVRTITMTMKKNFVQEMSGLKQGVLLDVGAGTGSFLNTMHNAGWQVEGIEPDDQAIRKAASVYGLQLKTPEHLFSLERSRFDVITLWHVLEHVHGLHEYIEQLKVLCRPGGKIIVAVPNFTSADAEKYGRYWAAYDVPRHLYHFSPASMNALMTLHNCVVDSIHPMWFDSFYVSLLSEKYQSGKPGFLRAMLAGLKSNLKAFYNKRKASSVIYVISPGPEHHKQSNPVA